MRLIDGDALMETINRHCYPVRHDMTSIEPGMTRIGILQAIQEQPTIERKTDEWCSDCKEYDSEKHCCPRFNRVIRQTLSEQRKTGKWMLDDEYIDCSACKREKWSRVPYEGLVKRFKFCPNCGADMRGEA